ncbi:hypothetical protein DL96DRAFT_1625578, partial [Flagelloscypha sp. PMI_526]
MKFTLPAILGSLLVASAAPLAERQVLSNTPGLPGPGPGDGRPGLPGLPGFPVPGPNTIPLPIPPPRPTNERRSMVKLVKISHRSHFLPRHLNNHRLNRTKEEAEYLESSKRFSGVVKRIRQSALTRHCLPNRLLDHPNHKLKEKTTVVESLVSSRRFLAVRKFQVILGHLLLHLHNRWPRSRLKYLTVVWLGSSKRFLG